MTKNSKAVVPLVIASIGVLLIILFSFLKYEYSRIYVKESATELENLFENAKSVTFYDLSRAGYGVVDYYPNDQGELVFSHSIPRISVKGDTASWLNGLITHDLATASALVAVKSSSGKERVFLVGQLPESMGWEDVAESILRIQDSCGEPCAEIKRKLIISK